MRGSHELAELRRAAREIFAEALADADAARAVGDCVRLEDARLTIDGDVFDLGDANGRVYSVAFGKAAHAMASALDSVLGERLAGGLLSAPASASHLARGQTSSRLARWQTFAGGHPVPDEESLRAAHAAFELLARADAEGALVVFLVSGGGSAMLEAPGDARLTLEDLREANRALVGCGASIAEVNAVRRALSAVKGGRLAARAPRAAQVSLVVSDVNTGEEANVASGPTYPAPRDAPEAAQVLARYRLDALLPPRAVRAIKDAQPHTTPDNNTSRAAATGDATRAPRKHHVLLDNTRAVEHAARAARERGFAVEVARDLVEQDVSEGARALVSRLVELRRRESGAHGVCIISGGEFACPVRGNGVGGRNGETALRCALEMEGGGLRMVALSAGTDGVDGNSPATGAFADDTTVRRARELGLDAKRFLDASDAYTFFDALGDALVTGPTGTNVRDLRIMLAR